MRPGIPNKNFFLGAIAIFAMSLVVVRACIQSATIDECDSFLAFAFGPDPMQWFPASGNHVLNSIVMRLATQIFGIHHLTLRSGALLGAALYISACFKLAAWLQDGVLAISLLGCLLLNPFILDLLVAARGYSMALGLLMCTVAIAIRYLRTGTFATGSAALASICAALSFSANFSFAFVDLSAVVLLFLLILLTSKQKWYRAAAAAFLPGLLTATLVVGSTVLSFPRSQLYFGASSLKEMWLSMALATTYVPNPEIVNPLLLPMFNILASVLPYVFYAAVLVLIMGALSRRFVNIPAYLFSILAVSFLLHLFLWRFFHLPLPRDRTGIFFVALSTLLAGYLVEAQRAGVWLRIARVIGIGALCVGSIYFLGCLRLFYFTEWIWNADTKEAHAVLDAAARQYATNNVFVGWETVAAMRFYDVYTGQSHNYFKITEPRPPGNILYVMQEGFEAEFLGKENPHILYRGSTSGVVVGVSTMQ
jgi:hypothetical protein